jgi:DNA-directed RNA polymerase II subunit RPB2
MHPLILTAFWCYLPFRLDFVVADEEEQEIIQEEAWVVISHFFESKGLVRQQLDSFDDFMEHAVQDLVMGSAPILLQPQPQHRPGDRSEADLNMRYKITFGQMYLSRPRLGLLDGSTDVYYPNEARLRDLTYDAPLYSDVTKTTIRSDGTEDPDEERGEKILLGRVPILLRSRFCHLHDKTDKELESFGECPYDTGGYFIINGGERVLIAQEKMSNNHVYVFKKAMPSKYSYVAEIRSVVEDANRPTSTFYVKYTARSATKLQTLQAQIPYIKKDIPVVILFRALGFVGDRDILEMIAYDFKDDALMELLRPSLEEAFFIQVIKRLTAGSKSGPGFYWHSR